MSRGPALALLLAVSLLHAAPAGAARKLVSHQGLTAYMPDGFACAEQVTIFVAGDRSAFRGEKLSLQRLTGGVRATLGFECPTPVQTIVFIGVADKTEVWRGISAQSNDWVLVDMASRGPSAPSPAPAAPTTPVTDTLDRTPAPTSPEGDPLASVDGGVLRFGRARTRTSELAILP